MNLIEKSLEIALRAHAGKRDKAGQTYILHPLRLMHQMKTDKEMAVALLHDVMEDSPISRQDLSDEGIPEEIIEAVACLTRATDESYEAFINRVLTNPLAARIKRADIADNINVLRLRRLGDQDLERIARYHSAWVRLTDGLL